MTYVGLIGKYLLHSNPDAMLWLLAYGLYAHAIDDIIDQDIPGDQTRQQFMLRNFEFAEAVFSNHFYISNVSKLRPLIKMTSQAYMDSVQWEGSSTVWKRQVSDGLRQIGNEVTLAVIEIVCGLEAKRQASLEFRELCWKTHHLKDGSPI